MDKTAEIPRWISPDGTTKVYAPSRGGPGTGQLPAQAASERDEILRAFELPDAVGVGRNIADEFRSFARHLLDVLPPTEQTAISLSQLSAAQVSAIKAVT